MTTQLRPLSTAEGFICGGLAACTAVMPYFLCFCNFHANAARAAQVTFSNPAEVAKTRLQLQGELAKDGGVRVYSSAVDVLAKTWRNEGIRGLQRGLPPAVSRILRLCRKLAY